MYKKICPRLIFYIWIFVYSLLLVECKCKPSKVHGKVEIPAIEFYFVRHGKTPWNKDDVLKGPKDLNLNEEGKKQAQKAGRAFKDRRSSFSNPKIVSSTLLRATDTAKAIQDIAGIPIVAQEEGLKELYYGDYRLTGDLYKAPPDAESMEYFRKRVMESLAKILKKYPASPLIIVSHQKVFECISEKLTGCKKKISLGSICHVVPKGNNTWEINLIEGEYEK
jgi:probable phosphoglycerate mutase